MQIHYGFDNINFTGSGVVATLGSFDGVHVGHRLLMRQLVGLAREGGMESVVLTFEPHPREVIHPDLVQRKLSTISEKLELMATTGVDHVVVINFTKEFSQMAPEYFITQYLIKRLGVRSMITGQGHFFGKGKSGQASTLRKFGIKTIDIDRFCDISSTLIRDTIQNGDMTKAQELLGDGYLVELPITTNSYKILPDTSIAYRVEFLDAGTIVSDHPLHKIIEGQYRGFIKIYGHE